MVQNNYDIIIAGGGYVGLCLALAVKQAAPQLSIVVVDATFPNSSDNDERAFAIAEAGRQLLSTLGLWDTLAPQAQAIRKMIITDSKVEDVLRPVYLTFDKNSGNDDAIAYMLPNNHLISTLQKRIRAAKIKFVHSQRVEDFEATANEVWVTLDNGEKFNGRLLIAADGARSHLRQLAGISTIGTEYDQVGIVTTIHHSEPHHGVAYEHFLPSGPFATLPLTGNRSSLVWTERKDFANRLFNDDPIVLQAALGQRLGHVLGDVEQIGRCKSFPLQINIARSFSTHRLALIGDAAHAMHPIAGQGLNFGFKDVAALAEVIIDAWRLGQDFGAAHILENYDRMRRADTLKMGIMTDMLNRLFSNNLTPIRLIRDLGLGMVERMPSLKDRFINEASGTHRDRMPRLLQGEPL